MATYNAPDLITRPRHMGGHGNAVIQYGSLTPTTGNLGDIYRVLVIPGGMDVTDIDLNFSDMDSAAAMAVKVGYVPLNAADGPAAVDDYFQAANTFISGTGGKRQLVFDPIKFEKPVVLTITVTTAATTFVAAKITAIVKGLGVGIK